MTNQDYDQKKRECFVQFCKDNGIDQEVNISIFDAFDQIFDRAYALGREKETITQEEIEEAAEDYVSFEKGGKCYPNYIVERACCCAFKDGANFALGKQEMKQESKQESKQETVISGWVARDKSGYLVLHYKKPHRTFGNAKWYSAQSQKSLPRDSFSDLTWDSDPIEVELIIKRKKNGNNSTDNRI